MLSIRGKRCHFPFSPPLSKPRHVCAGPTDKDLATKTQRHEGDPFGTAVLGALVPLWQRFPVYPEYRQTMKLHSTPAAIADPMTPDELHAIPCISR